MKKNKKQWIKDYLIAIKYIFMPPHKDFILRPGRKKINSERFVICKLFLNDEKMITDDGKFFKAPIDLYKAVVSVIARSNDIYFTRNQKGFNTYFHKNEFDIIITDRGGKVLDLFKKFPINKISNHYEQGYFVYYFQIGSITYYNIKHNDLLSFKRNFMKINENN